MILFDTEHVSVLKMPDGDRRRRLVGRMATHIGTPITIAVIAPEETMRGWLAAIAITRDALLLTANKRDCEQVPGLRFDNWMDE